MCKSQYIYLLYQTVHYKIRLILFNTPITFLNMQIQQYNYHSVPEFISYSQTPTPRISGTELAQIQQILSLLSTVTLSGIRSRLVYRFQRCIFEASHGQLKRWKRHSCYISKGGPLTKIEVQQLNYKNPYVHRTHQSKKITRIACSISLYFQKNF